MTDTPTTTPRAQAQHAERLAREAQALRRNLVRRKQQQRARIAATPTTPPDTVRPSPADPPP